MAIAQGNPILASDIPAIYGTPSQMEFKNYTGNGQAGSASPCSLTFSFAPDIVILLSPISLRVENYTRSTIAINMSTLTTSYPSLDNPSQGFVLNGYFQNSNCHFGAKKSSDGKTVYWYYYDSGGQAENNAAMQCNTNGTKYYFLGIKF